MKITRHNYEEYFILYMDNELGSDERREVEAFVALHPDLKDELDLLFQYKLVPDTSLVFTGKEDLLKTANETTISSSNYEEWLVLYMDNELNPAQQKQVEEFIATHPAAKEELALLQRTKLPAEEIVFANKAVLYREEEKVRRIPVRWWRIAAAAILLLGIGITAALVLNKKNDDVPSKGLANEKKTVPANNTTNSELVTTPKENKLPVNEAIVNNNTNNTKKQNNPEPVLPVIKQQTDKNVAIKEKKPVEKIVAPLNTPALIKEEQPIIANNNKPSNELPKPVNNPNIVKNNDANNAIAVNAPKDPIVQKDPLTNPSVTNKTDQPSDIHTVGYTTDVAALDQPDDKKSKNRGLFRKIARTFEKRTNIDPTDDNKLLVAGLSLRLK